MISEFQGIKVLFETDFFQELRDTALPRFLDKIGQGFLDGFLPGFFAGISLKLFDGL